MNNDIATSSTTLLNPCAMWHRLLLCILINWSLLLPEAILSPRHRGIWYTPKTKYYTGIPKTIRIWFEFNDLTLFETICNPLCFCSPNCFFPLSILQLFDSVSSTYTYLLGDLTTKEAILIDPVLEHAKRDKKLLEELGFQLKYASKYDSNVFAQWSASVYRWMRVHIYILGNGTMGIGYRNAVDKIYFEIVASCFTFNLF